MFNRSERLAEIAGALLTPQASLLSAIAARCKSYSVLQSAGVFMEQAWH